MWRGPASRHCPQGGRRGRAAPRMPPGTAGQAPPSLTFPAKSEQVRVSLQAKCLKLSFSLFFLLSIILNICEDKKVRTEEGNFQFSILQCLGGPGSVSRRSSAVSGAVRGLYSSIRDFRLRFVVCIQTVILLPSWPPPPTRLCQIDVWRSALYY